MAKQSTILENLGSGSGSDSNTTDYNRGIPLGNTTLMVLGKAESKSTSMRTLAYKSLDIEVMRRSH